MTKTAVTKTTVDENDTWRKQHVTKTTCDETLANRVLSENDIVPKWKMWWKRHRWSKDDIARPHDQRKFHSIVIVPWNFAASIVQVTWCLQRFHNVIFGMETIPCCHLWIQTISQSFTFLAQLFGQNLLPSLDMQTTAFLETTSFLIDCVVCIWTCPFCNVGAFRYQTLSASPASIVAANAIIAFGLLQGHTISTADAVKAYLQSSLQSHAATWVRLPKEVWPAEWFGADGRPKYRRPVIRLWRSLYGHPEAGSHWERHLEKELLAMSATKISEFPSTYIFDNYGGLALIVYVDDFVLAGDSEWHSRFWEDLSKRVIIDEVGDIGRFLGRHHATVKCEGQERFAFDMRSYAKDMIQEYVQLTGMPNFKKAHTPFLSKVAEKLEEEEPIGRLSSLASSILMKLMWISRLARPDLLRATTWLATKIHAWTASCDGHIHRVMSYLHQTQDSLLTGWIRDPKEALYVEMFVDADFCGDEDHCFSTSGGWIQISGPDSQFPLAWISKKQGAIARSTTEAETAAMAYVLVEEGLPLLELMKRLLSPNVKLRVREDNEATAKVVTAGYSKRLRHMKRTHKINIASIAAELSKDDLELMLVNTLHQKGDLFTKAVAGPLWGNAMKLIALIEEYEIIKTSSAGLKMTGTEDISLEQAIGPEQDGVAVPAFKKRKKRKPQRVPQFLQADDWLINHAPFMDREGGEEITRSRMYLICIAMIHGMKMQLIYLSYARAWHV